MTPEEGRPTIAEVSLAALRHNCREARRLAGAGTGVLAVVKADGYGHGAVAAGRAFLEAGAWGLGVSAVAEAVALREAGIGGPIVVLGGAFPGEAAAVVRHDLDVAVWSLERAAELARRGQEANAPVRVHLKVDTGMTRLGVDAEDARPFAEALLRLEGLRLVGVFSHLASADALETEAVRAQLARFRASVAAVQAVGIDIPLIHLANSAATLALPEARFTLVRPGLMLYGYPPAPHLAAHAALRPAMRLRTRIAQLRDVAVGTPVGYGGSWRAQRPSRIATLPLGYADGYHRLASNRGEMLLCHRRVPIAGRVCMDHVMLDVTEVPQARVGDLVTAFGPQGPTVLGADHVAGWMDTIPYEVLTSVGARVPRSYAEEFSDA